MVSVALGPLLITIGGTLGATWQACKYTSGFYISAMKNGSEPKPNKPLTAAPAFAARQSHGVSRFDHRFDVSVPPLQQQFVRLHRFRSLAAVQLVLDVLT